jgi:hypothetical protein
MIGEPTAEQFERIIAANTSKVFHNFSIAKEVRGYTKGYTSHFQATLETDMLKYLMVHRGASISQLALHFSISEQEIMSLLSTGTGASVKEDTNISLTDRLSKEMGTRESVPKERLSATARETAVTKLSRGWILETAFPRGAK